MTQTTIYENEEAQEFLNYFVAYKKIQTKIETIKCLTALNPNPPNTPDNTIQDAQNSPPEPTITLPK